MAAAILAFTKASQPSYRVNLRRENESGPKRLDRLGKNTNCQFELMRKLNVGYSYEPRDHGESNALLCSMYRNAVYDEGGSGSSNGYRWQPVSDLEWCRLFEKTWHNKRFAISHSESYMVESNEGKPKIPRKGQGKKVGHRAKGVVPAKKMDPRDAQAHHLQSKQTNKS